MILFSGTLILAICHAAITWRSNLWYGPHIYVVGPRALFVVFIRHLFVTQSRFADNIIQEQCLLIMLQELMFMDVKVCLRYVITINKIMGSSVQFLHQLIIGCIKAEGIQCPKCLYYQTVQLFYCATSKNHEKLARLVLEHILKFQNQTIPLLLHSSGKFDMKKIGPDSPRFFCRICKEAIITKS